MKPLYEIQNVLAKIREIMGVTLYGWRFRGKMMEIFKWLISRNCTNFLLA